MLTPISFGVIAVFAAATLSLLIQSRNTKKRAQVLADKLQSMHDHCLTGLGDGLAAVCEGDFSKRVEPATTPVQAGTGNDPVSILERNFNQMLSRAQSGVGAYNDVAEKFGFMVSRTAQLGDRLESLRVACLTGLGSALVAMQDGDLTHRLEPKTTPLAEDENDIAQIATLVQTFNAMLAQAQGGLEAYNNVADQWTHIIESLQSVAGKLENSAQDLSGSSNEVRKGMDEITTAMTDLTQGAEKQVLMLIQASDLTGEAGQSSTNSTENAQSGVDASIQTSDAIKQLQCSNANVLESMQDLNNKTGQIGSIVASISGIADQTNLLALNAAIEAARAGEQGRGFAVVAEEVRKLAKESQTAARTIADILENISSSTKTTMNLVETSVTQTNEGLNLTLKAQESFLTISASVTQVSANIGEIEKVSSNIAQVATDSSASTQEVSASSQQVHASMEMVSENTEHLNGLAQELTVVTSKFKTKGTSCLHLVEDVEVVA